VLQSPLSRGTRTPSTKSSAGSSVRSGAVSLGDKASPAVGLSGGKRKAGRDGSGSGTPEGDGEGRGRRRAGSRSRSRSVLPVSIEEEGEGDTYP
jgi:hypothetical protein